MKKTFIFLIFSQFCFSQIDSGSYTSKYISHYKLADNDYVENLNNKTYISDEPKVSDHLKKYSLLDKPFQHNLAK